MLRNNERLGSLQSRYPRIFGAGKLQYGLEHQSGWDDLIDTMSSRINTILSSDLKCEIELLQVKEKFGELRIYYRLRASQVGTTAAVAEAVKIAQEASGNICEVCGKPGMLLRGNLMKTRCASCASI